MIPPNMNAAESAESAVAQRFIDFYGYNGTVYSQNVTDFLASISMSTEMLDKVSTTPSECPSSRDLDSISWTKSNASGLLSVLIDAIQTPSCYERPPLLRAVSDEHEHEKNSPVQVWGYGLLFVTLINLCAVLGIVFLPFMGRRVYKLLMTFMVSLAVGSLVATALLILLPDCLQLAFIHEEVNKENSSLIHDHDHDHHHHLFHADHPGHATWEDFLSVHPWYLWRCCTVFAGIYMFFIIERLLKELMRWKTGISGHGHSRMSAVAPENPNTMDIDLTISDKTPADDDPEKASMATPEVTTAYGSAPMLPSTRGGCCGCAPARLAAVQPVAWMILLGDALHNFLDGVSIGVAFTRSTRGGISICLAVLCEELPHELGDFAILLSSGMSMPMALACNFLSACTCYLGFALGVLLGETGASVWVFAIASGMFLYISLVDMMPEMNNAMDDPETKRFGRGKAFVLQNLGLLVGTGAVLLLALYGGNIQVG